VRSGKGGYRWEKEDGRKGGKDRGIGDRGIGEERGWRMEDRGWRIVRVRKERENR